MASNLKFKPAENKTKLTNIKKAYPSGIAFYNLLGSADGQRFLNMPLLTLPTSAHMDEKLSRKNSAHRLNNDAILAEVLKYYVLLDKENLIQQAMLGYLCDFDIETCDDFLKSKTLKNLTKTGTFAISHKIDKHDNKSRAKWYNSLRTDPVGLHTNLGNWKKLR